MKELPTSSGPSGHGFAELVTRLRSELCRAADAGDLPRVVSALRLLVDAHGGVSMTSRRAGAHRSSVRRVLAPGANPSLRTFIVVLRAVGLRLTVASDDAIEPPVLRTRRARGRARSSAAGR
jgi:DNA-binding phage protein